MPTPVALDDIDAELLELLQRDCKTPLAKLGEKVGLSAPAVMDRVRKLEQAGVITGYHARIDGRRLGYDITAFVGVSASYPRDIEQFLKALSDPRPVLECHHVTGAHTLLLKVKVADTASLERLISDVRAIEGVTATDTMVVLSTASERHDVSLPADAERPAPKRRRARAKSL